MKEIILKIIKFLSLSNLWIALASALFYWLTVLQLGERLVLSNTVVFLFFSSLFIYTLFQLLDVKDNIPMLSKFVLYVSIIVIITCVPFLSYTSLSVLAISGLLTFFYATPLFSFGKNNFNLRKLWFLKAIIVALVWTLSCAVVPMLEYGASTHQLFWFSLEKFLFILSVALPYDIKDIAKDTEENGMTSFVMKFGVATTKKISFALFFIAFVMALILYSKFFIAIFITYSFAFLCIYKLKTNTSAYQITFLIDSSIILYFLSFWISSFL